MKTACQWMISKSKYLIHWQRMWLRLESSFQWKF